MNPDGRYLKWLRSQDHLTNEVALWYMRAVEQADNDNLRRQLEAEIAGEL